MTFPQGFSAQYGSPQAYYGDIQYGRWEPYQEPYGAWPESTPIQQGMLTSDWQEEQVIQPVIDTSIQIAANIAIIKKLKQELLTTENTDIRQRLRDDIEFARLAKVKAFKLAAQIDEEESTFLLLH